MLVWRVTTDKKLGEHIAELLKNGVEDSDFQDIKFRGCVNRIEKLDSASIIEFAEIKSIEVVVFDDRILPEINDTATIA